MYCDLVRVEDLSLADEAVWNAMLAATPAFASPLLVPAFSRFVARVRDDVRIAIWRKGGQTVAILPHHHRPDGFARPVGAPFSDYTALITWPEPGFEIAALLGMAGITELQVIGLIDPYRVFGDFDGEDDTAYGMDLTQPVDMPKKHEKNVNRLRRNLELAHGEVALIAADRDPSRYWRMMSLKRAQMRTSGLHDFLAPAWVQRLMLMLADAPPVGLHGQMLSLTAGGQGISFQFGLRLNERMHPWIATYDPAYSAFSPGQIFLRDCISALQANGVSYYDLSTGTTYKNAFSNTQLIVKHGHAYGLSPKGESRARVAQAVTTATRLMGPRVNSIARRIGRRFEQICTLEPHLGGRVKGVAMAATAFHRRLRD